MNFGRSVLSWWTSATKTAIGDLVVTATVVMFLFGVAAAVLLGCEFLFDMARHTAAN